MTCPSEARLAAAASGEDPGAAIHAETCPRCARITSDHAELVALARMLPSPRFSRERRAGLAAEVVASVVPAARGRTMPVIVGIAALAAVVALVVSRRHEPAVVAIAPAPAPRPIVTPLPVPEPAPRGVLATPEVITRRVEVTQVIEAVVRIPETVSELVVKTGVVASHQMFAPAKMRTATAIDRDEWQPTLDPTGASLAAFRDGWEALRAGRNAAAIAAFDRATDPVVAEDATYWAAIAAQRADDRDDALRRLRAFLDRFPRSPRADYAASMISRMSSTLP